MGSSMQEISGTCFSIQESYILYYAPTGVLTCNDVIKVPCAQLIKKNITINNATYYVMPVIELITPNERINVKIITNEGITIEPLNTANFITPLYAYKTHLYFALPFNATGVKGYILASDREGLKSNLSFKIMMPPYNYDNALFAVVGTHLNYTLKLVANLTNRVNALENRQHYVNRVGISDSPDFFVLPGSEDHTNVLGWEFTFSNGEGRKLTLTYHSSTTTNAIFRDIDITGSKLLALAYNSVSSVCNLYALTESTDGSIITQRLIASGFGQIIGVSQPLHLFIDNVEQNAVEIGTGFEVFI